MTATLNDFRQISSQSAALFRGGAVGFFDCVFQFSISVIPLYKRSYKLFNINASGGYRILEDNQFVGNPNRVIIKNGVFHYGFLTDNAILSSLFGPGLNYVGGGLNLLTQNQPNFPIGSASALAQADLRLQANDIQKSLQQSIFYSTINTYQDQQTLYNNFLNARTLFTLPFGKIDMPIPNQFSVQSDPVAFSTSFIIPPGFDNLVILPFCGVISYFGGAGGVPIGYGRYDTDDGFDISSLMTFNMLPVSPEDLGQSLQLSV